MAGNRLPIIGPWKAKLTRIKNVAIVDCVPNGFVVIAGIAVAAFHVFWAVSGPECIDSTWDRVKKPGRKHRKFAAKGTVFGPTIAAPKGSFANTLIPLGDLAQKVGFFFGIVDGALDGVYYGESLIHRYTGCKSLASPFAQLSIIPGLPFLLPAGTGIIQNWKVDDNLFYTAGPGGIAINGPIVDLVTVACALNQIKGVFPTLPDATFSYRVCWYPSMSPVQQHWGGLGHTIDGTGTFFGQDILRHPTDQILVCEVTKSEGVLYFDQGFFSASGGGAQANLSPYTCGTKTGNPT